MITLISSGERKGFQSFDPSFEDQRYLARGGSKLVNSHLSDKEILYQLLQDKS